MLLKDIIGGWEGSGGANKGLHNFLMLPYMVEICVFGFIKKFGDFFGTLSNFFWQLKKRYEKNIMVFLYDTLGKVKIYK